MEKIGGRLCMEVLLQGKTCVFMDDALMIKGERQPRFL